ncbi:MAG: sensor histidine kinase [Pseudomonadota bacterium]|nr:sensor histidine kinase [Pseudomonadota bacterium]
MTVAPFAGQPSRFEIEGPDLPLAPETAVTLALALHELATNAAKHGALPVPHGHVDVRWAAEGGRLQLVWSESGGPEVPPPARRGFGSRMIERALAAEFGGTASLHFRKQGGICTVDAPWPQRQNGASQPAAAAA